MKLTLKTAEKMMNQNGGSLDLRYCTRLTAFPDNLTVGGSLDLSGYTKKSDKQSAK